MWDVFKGTVTPVAGVSLVLGITWWAFWKEHEETHELERTADQDADDALDSIGGGGDKDNKKKKKKGKKSNTEKGKGKEMDKDGEGDGE